VRERHEQARLVDGAFDPFDEAKPIQVGMDRQAALHGRRLEVFLCTIRVNVDVSDTVLNPNARRHQLSHLVL